MKCATRKLRSPLKWHGGKSYLARRIIELFPPHLVYCEPFLGGGSVLLNKVPVEHEYVGDINADLISFWSDLSRYPGAINTLAWRLPYEEATFRAALDYRPDDPKNGAFEATFAFWVRNRFSRGGLGKDFAWSDRLRGGQPGDVNAWDTIRAELPGVCERIEGVDFECCEAKELIRTIDGCHTLHYCDPPYLHETRTHRKAYAHEMSNDEHRELLSLLRDCRGAVVLSGYRNVMYDSLLADWTRHDFEMPNHSGQGKTKQRRVECLWIKDAE